MLQLEKQIQETKMPQSTKTAILVIGGAEDKVHGREILHTFWNRAGGSEAIIGIIPSASREPVLIGERYQRIFEEMGAKFVKVLDIRDRAQGEDPAFQEYVEECTGIFLTGGDQLRLCGLLADTPLMERIRQRVQLGEMSIAGTSAGAAVMGHHMIAGGSSGECPNRALVDMAMGLAIIPEVIVDQHFHNRNRMSRLLSAISGYPERLGIGIDEDTCALFEKDGTIQVIGRGTVTIVDAREMSYTNQAEVGTSDPLSLHNLRIHILSYGDCYHMYQHQAIAKNEQNLNL
ncbi:cyanophycinase [Gloeothece verrucosa]|uniref:Cyanophycinase n=1 Tax=Gloeothece verrucosa (strain PCC 7822) TaxID=497965 RepID=E0U6L7_GLOV7|nr:cyanophycinase [Gloeothece verrucosa]ADN14776.1 cyanophycinase [Gloeothece verrucosa PCC 7822]